MRRLSLLIVFLLMMVAAPLHAQEATPEPVDPATLVERAEAAAERAEAALEEISVVEQRANDAVGLAGDLFGLFEAMSAAIGIFVPLLVVIGGLFGLRQLQNAKQELEAATKRFEEDMHQRTSDLETARANFEKQTEDQRHRLEEAVQQQQESAKATSIALSLLLVGDSQYRAQDYTGALDTYERALGFDKLNPGIHYRMGYVYTQSGQLKAAQQSLEAALALDAKYTPARAALGYVYRRIGDDIQKEITRLKEVGIEPTNPEFVRLTTERDQTYIKSEQNFMDALTTLPNLVDEDGESWWGALGGLYRRRGQTEQAITAYNRATDVTPQSSYPFSNLALLYAKVGHLTEMAKTYERVEKLAYAETQADVDNYWAFADLIVSRLAQGKVQETYDVLDTALATAPADSPYTLESLIDTLRRLADYMQADQAQPLHDVIAYIQNFIDKRAQRIEEADAIVSKLTDEHEAIVVEDDEEQEEE